MLSFIPNFITILNLLCGCLAIHFAYKANLEFASYLVFIAVALDFLDGLAARALKAYSEIGKQLDSLADVVSFGVAPAAILIQFLGQSSSSFSVNGYHAVYLLSPLIIPAASALRLAKFNVDTRQTGSFLGLPTPANAMMLVSIPLIIPADSLGLHDFFRQPFVVPVLCLVTSLLMVTEIPLFSLKIKRLEWSDNQVKIIFVVLSAGLFFIFLFSAVILIIGLYVVLSLLINRFEKRKKAV